MWPLGGQRAVALTSVHGLQPRGRLGPMPSTCTAKTCGQWYSNTNHRIKPQGDSTSTFFRNLEILSLSVVLLEKKKPATIACLFWSFVDSQFLFKRRWISWDSAKWGVRGATGPVSMGAVSGPSPLYRSPCLRFLSLASDTTPRSSQLQLTKWMGFLENYRALFILLRTSYTNKNIYSQRDFLRRIVQRKVKTLRKT